MSELNTIPQPSGNPFLAPLRYVDPMRRMDVDAGVLIFDLTSDTRSGGSTAAKKASA